ncbi:hypothetical protein WOSG25_120070 [Weissella oryzae SG25]|uniref:Integral membrane protein n=1 Tax=Weissella oryzae (strain DSM 25784 / JCM 18191 / LMG 30913 / SG25) TaxID=1329250 RepID=A0A069D2F8_WEIOS|nr:hypothetical protein [Weissella oryzae]GAK31616.1 hypothetical protein WOSG25_120070 [Weissella oryzae SG25]
MDNNFSIPNTQRNNIPHKQNNQPDLQNPKVRFTWRDFPYISMFLATIAQLVIWWVYPLIYSKNLEGGRWQENPVLLAYSLLCALVIFWTFRHGFEDWKNYLVLLIPALSLYFLYQRMSGQQVSLVALLPIAMVLIQVRWLNLQNILGLIMFSAIATVAFPVTIFYQQNTYLTIPFLLSLLPLFLSYLFYMSSLFITQGRSMRLTALVFGIMLLLNVLSLPWNVWTILATLIILFTWMVLINLNLKRRYRFGVYAVLQMITVMLIFLQQK